MTWWRNLVANLKPGGDTSFSERRTPSAAVEVLNRDPALRTLKSNWGERRGSGRSSGASAAEFAVPGPKNSCWSLSTASVLIREDHGVTAHFLNFSRQGLVYGMWSPPPPIRASLRPSLPRPENSFLGLNSSRVPSYHAGFPETLEATGRAPEVLRQAPAGGGQTRPGVTSV